MATLDQLLSTSATKSTHKLSMTVIIPGFNEENNLEGVFKETLEAIKNRFSSYEIILVNDGSTDRTGAIADRLAVENPHVQVIHHEHNIGLGQSVRKGYELATKDYVMWNPGDHGMLGRSLPLMFDEVGKADMIIPYLAEPGFRSWKRQLVSNVYLTMMNLLFGLKIKYYNGPVIYRSELIKGTKTSSLRFVFFAEALILLLKAGYSYIEIPTYHQKRVYGSSKAFSLKNLVEILFTVAQLFWDVHIKRAKRISVLSKVQGS